MFSCHSLMMEISALILPMFAQQILFAERILRLHLSFSSSELKKTLTSSSWLLGRHFNCFFFFFAVLAGGAMSLDSFTKELIGVCVCQNLATAQYAASRESLITIEASPNTRDHTPTIFKSLSSVLCFRVFLRVCTWFYTFWTFGCDLDCYASACIARGHI